jgi:hypothetical protein
MRTVTLCLVLTLFVAGSAFAQPARTGRLLVTVADQTGAIIPAATVTTAVAGMRKVEAGMYLTF